ncbi:MAG: TonB-dependent receptor domain-containing protein [Asticcacaulis sp.]|uniref:TonB-dependent receptor domain-containing protein n=1 Tax=Asticcacaulis sp. TaxID=1872648 RepID=UPI003F7C6E6E
MRRSHLPVMLLALAPLVAHAQDAGTTITVEGKKRPVKKAIDSTTYDVSNSPKAANGTAQDVLQAVPGVSVTADGQISVKGQSQVTVLIDGKPSAVMSGPDRAVALQTMNGSDIASVEVITDPSAAYNANGGAILNIVLKKNRNPGARGSLRAAASDQGLWNVAASGDATRGKISIHASAAFRRDGTLKYRGSSLQWRNLLTGETGATRQSSEVFIRRIVESASLGFDDDLSDKDTLSFATNYHFRRSRPWFDELNQRSDGEAFHRISYGPNQQSDGAASLSFSHQGEAALKLFAQSSATIALVDKSYHNDWLTPVQPADYHHGLSKSAKRLNEVSADWSRPVAGGQWGIGADAQNEVNDLTNYQAAIDPATGAETPDANVSNRFRVATELNAAYVTRRFDAGQWQVLLGARFEAMALRLTSTGYAHDTDWAALNPSLNAQYALAKTDKLTLSYRRSLQRPDPEDLNPFTTYLDAQNRARGNPDLKPQILTAYEVNEDHDGDHISRGFGVFYRVSRDTVVETRRIEDGDILLTTKQNGGRARSYGATGSLDWTPNDVWSLRSDIGAYHVSLTTPDLDGPVRQNAVSGYLNLNLSYSKGRDSVSLDGHAQSGGLWPLGQYGPTQSVNLSWTRRLSPRFSLTVNANDIFDGNKSVTRMDAATFHTRGYNHFVARRLYIGFMRRLG